MSLGNTEIILNVNTVLERSSRTGIPNRIVPHCEMKRHNQLMASHRPRCNTTHAYHLAFATVSLTLRITLLPTNHSLGYRISLMAATAILMLSDRGASYPRIIMLMRCY